LAELRVGYREENSLHAKSAALPQRTDVADAVGMPVLPILIEGPPP